MLTKIPNPKFQIRNVEFIDNLFQIRIKRKRFLFWSSVSMLSNSDRSLFADNFLSVQTHLAARVRFGDKYTNLAHVKDRNQINLSIFNSLMNHIRTKS